MLHSVYQEKLQCAKIPADCCYEYGMHVCAKGQESPRVFILIPAL